MAVYIIPFSFEFLHGIPPGASEVARRLENKFSAQSSEIEENGRTILTWFTFTAPISSDVQKAMYHEYVSECEALN